MPMGDPVAGLTLSDPGRELLKELTAERGTSGAKDGANSIFRRFADLSWVLSCFMKNPRSVYDGDRQCV